MEKRKHERLVLENASWDAELFDQLNGEKIGEVVNLSTNGLMVITSRALEPKSLYQVECICRGPRAESVRFSAGVEVLWASPAGQAGTTWAGLQIIDMAHESRIALLKIKGEIPEG